MGHLALPVVVTIGGRRRESIVNVPDEDSGLICLNRERRFPGRKAKIPGGSERLGAARVEAATSARQDAMQYLVSPAGVSQELGGMGSALLGADDLGTMRRVQRHLAGG